MEHWAQCSGVDPHQPYCEQQEPSAQILSPTHPEPHVPLAIDCCVGTPNICGLAGLRTLVEGCVGEVLDGLEAGGNGENGLLAITAGFEEFGALGLGAKGEGAVGLPPQYSWVVPHQPNCEQHEPSGQIPSPMEPPPHVPFVAGEGGLIGPFTGAEGFVGFPPQYSEEVPHQPNCEQHEPSEQIPFPTDPPPHVPPDPLGIFALGAKGEDLVRFGDEGVGLIGVPIDVGFVKLGMEGSRGVGFGPKGACLIGMTAEGEGLVGLNGGASFGALGIATEGDGIPGVIGFLKLGFEGVL
mmetsp:Transcript_27264/g.39071  ORF Transcript_27264/g.39071 Transcript_27264/m.39071 type:complete len:296 (-) Transcript_27264:515-1402(-)